MINNFLAGEFILSFILKAVSMLLISAAVFAFYLYDIKRTKVTDKSLVMRIFFFSLLYRLLRPRLSLPGFLLKRRRLLERNVWIKVWLIISML